MKRTLIALTFGLITYNSFGQWSNTSNNGTQGAVKIKNYLLFDADGDFTGGNYFTIQDDPTNNYLRIGYGFNNHLSINSQGKIGIGVTTPDKNLTIQSEIKIIKSGNSRTQGDKAQLIFGEKNNDYYSGSIVVENTNSNPGYVNPKMSFILQDYNSHTPDKLKERMVIFPNGNIGIGTTNPNGWKLAVNGNIRAKEIKVETGWSDFVFENDYKLPTLQEVENHIKEKGHLKDIPSAKEVEKNGIFLGEMDSKLLQKIEELTLYTIAQEKKIKELESLNTKFIELQKRMEKLEKK
tara:strand:- start:167 stop:1048 length:882 start_codon:yes stop_codon:yes gene_type:complete